MITVCFKVRLELSSALATFRYELLFSCQLLFPKGNDQQNFYRNVMEKYLFSETVYLGGGIDGTIFVLEFKHVFQEDFIHIHNPQE